MLDGGKKRIKSAILTMSVGLTVNAALFAVKLFIGLSSNSIGILVDAFNNMGDTFSCLIGILSFAVMKMRNKELAFGYGRMEYIADFLMAIILCCVGGAFLYNALERMVLVPILRFSWRYFIIIAVTAAAKVVLGVFYMIRNKTADSGVIKASAFDSFTDAGITSMTLIGYALNGYANLRIDSLFGIAISGIILANGIKLLISSIKTLLGRKLDEDRKKEIVELCKRHSEVADVVGMNLHQYGAEYEQLVVDLVFTKDVNYDKIINTVSELSDEIQNEYGYFPKICIARSYEKDKEQK